MSQLVLTWVSNCNQNNFPEYKVFFKSLRATGYSDEIVILTNSLDPEYREEFKKFDCVIQDVDPQIQVYYILRDRHLAFWNFLNTNKHLYKKIIIADARDIVFQKNPFDVQIVQNITLASEGFLHRDSAFNCVDQLHAQRVVRDFDHKYADWPVINGGFIYGTNEAIKNFCFLIWSNSVKTAAGVTDQAVINYLYNAYLRHDDDYYVADPHKSSLILTGEAVKENLIQVYQKYHQICMNNDEIYYVFHQWDRTIFAKEILQKYS